MSIIVRDVSKNFGDFAALDRRVRRHPDRGAHRAARAQRRRQVDAAAGHRRPGDSPTRGLVEIEGARRHRRCRRSDRGVGFVFQHYAAFKHMTVRAQRRLRPGDPQAAQGRDQRSGSTSCSSSCTWSSSPTATRRSSPAASGSGWRWPARSPSSRQVLLLDEPFGALDAQVRKELRAWLRRLHDQVHVTTVFVTHDQEEAMEVADSIVVMADGEVEQVGTPDELYDEPANDFVMSFLGPVTTLGGAAGPPARPRALGRAAPRAPSPRRSPGSPGSASRCASTSSRRRRALGPGHPRHLRAARPGRGPDPARPPVGAGPRRSRRRRSPARQPARRRVALMGTLDGRAGHPRVLLLRRRAGGPQRGPGRLAAGCSACGSRGAREPGRTASARRPRWPGCAATWSARSAAPGERSPPPAPWHAPVGDVPSLLARLELAGPRRSTASCGSSRRSRTGPGWPPGWPACGSGPWLVTGSAAELVDGLLHGAGHQRRRAVGAAGGLRDRGGGPAVVPTDCPGAAQPLGASEVDPHHDASRRRSADLGQAGRCEHSRRCRR